MEPYYFDLENLLIQKHVSKNKVCVGCSMERTQLNKICRNKACRIDLETLKRLCIFLECTPNDILIATNPLFHSDN